LKDNNERVFPLTIKPTLELGALGTWLNGGMPAPHAQGLVPSPAAGGKRPTPEPSNTGASGALVEVWQTNQWNKDQEGV
jgi:hypothetical protein